MADTLVIIVTWNGMRWLPRCMESVLASTDAADIFIVDNGSTDGTVKWIWDNTSESVKLHVSAGNDGFGAANNVAMRYAIDKGYSYVYLLNQDAYLGPDTISRLKKAFESPEGHGFGVLSPVQTDASGTRWDAAFKRHCEKALTHSSSRITEVGFVMAAHWMIRCDALKDVGGFSPAFQQYGEDDNWLHRLLFHGYRCGVVREASAIHDRASRQLDKEQKMNLKCISTVVKISDPTAHLAWRILREPLELLAMGIIHLSWTPISFIPKLIRSYPRLIRLRKESKQKGAFL